MRLKDNRVLVWLIYLLCVGLFFFPLAVNNVLLTVLLFYCAFTTNVKDIKRNLLENKYAQILILVFIAQAIGLLYTTNMTYGMFMLEKKVSFLVIPVFLLPVLTKNNINFQRIFKRIGEISFYGSLGLVLIALFRKFVLHYDKAFYFESFRSFEGFAPIHYVYFAMFFGCGSLFYIESMSAELMKRKYGYVIIIALFIYSTVIMILVSSKTGIVAFVGASIILLYYKIPNKRAFGFSIAMILISSSTLLYFNETTRDRFLLGLSHDFSILSGKGIPENIEFTDLNMRLVFWKITLTHLFSDNLFLTGVGTGDVQDYIDSHFILPQYQITGYLGWNSHNQWIYTLTQIGLMGLLSIFLIFFYPLWRSIKKSNVKFLIFLIISLAFSLTESIFEVNKGIVYFSLFMTLFAASEKDFDTQTTF